MMKWTKTTVLLCGIIITLVFNGSAAAASSTDDDYSLNSIDDGDETAVHDGPTARFAFVNLNSDGSISFTFNATSLQYTLLAALTALVLASVLLPLLGLINIGSAQPDYGYAYTDQSGYTGASYDVPAPSYGSGSSYGGGYGKRLIKINSKIF
jgi:hypothetical protein